MAQTKKSISNKSIEKVEKEPKELVTTASDVSVNKGIALNKGTAKKPANVIKSDKLDEFIYNRSGHRVTIFEGGVKYVIPAKGKVRR